LRGGNALAADGGLASYARAWARYMAEHNVSSHSNFRSLLGVWTIVGENIGVGASPTQIFQTLSSSPTHLANMVNPYFTHVGVGVWVDAGGVMWTAHVFGG
jgi:uncharacterized protein YkwD